MKKIYTRPETTVDSMMAEQAIMGLSIENSNSKYLTIPFARYDEENVPTEADANSHSFNPWGDEEGI